MKADHLVPHWEHFEHGADIGVRTLHTGLRAQDILAHKQSLAEALYARIPAGVGSTGNIHPSHREMEAMLRGGARRAVEQGYGEEAPGAYKDVSKVVAAADRAGLAKNVARLEPLVLIKG